MLPCRDANSDRPGIYRGPASTFPGPVVEALAWPPKGAGSGFHLPLEELFRSL
ncbi:MAG: hypothetical protein ABI765_06605 [Gemmatimonadota bacterium]